MSRWLIALAALAGLGACTAAAEPPAGPRSETGQTVAELDGTRFDVFTFHPAGCRVSGILLVFHGLGRNVAGYRNDAIPLASRACMAIVAPLFDKERFPGRSYQRGGAGHGDAPQTWTVRYVALLADWARQREGRPDLPYTLIGHSAGAQFLSRVAAYTDDQAKLTVIANPSTWVRARLDIAAPYGFGGLTPPGEAEAALRRYLATPILVLLGSEDHGTEDLASSKEAVAQGSDRLDRGQTVFHEAQEAARQHDWPFNWRVAVVPGVGHSARDMFISSAARQAVTP